MSGFEGLQGLHMGEIPRAIGNRDSILKGCLQNLTCSESQHRGTSLKGVCFRPTCCSWRASETGRKQLGLPLGTEKLEAAIFGSSFYLNNTSTGKHHFRILPLAYQCQGPGLSSSKLASALSPAGHAMNHLRSLPHLPADGSSPTSHRLKHTTKRKAYPALQQACKSCQEAPQPTKLGFSPTYQLPNGS